MLSGGLNIPGLDLDDEIIAIGGGAFIMGEIS